VKRVCDLWKHRGADPLYRWGTIADVGAVLSGGHWRLCVNVGIGSGVTVTAVCITNVANRVQLSNSECSGRKRKTQQPCEQLLRGTDGR
jgi:hypothetical protein